jgi:hypothetical protein
LFFIPVLGALIAPCITGHVASVLSSPIPLMILPQFWETLMAYQGVVSVFF